jgi:23S rRNA (cytidine1920-2'-O)/16S rRNA (cytidine1409-2'-O)-methyltransferase
MRLDLFLEKNNFFDSRTKAKQAIERGEILVNGRVIDKSSYQINDDKVNIQYVYNSKYVSLGGYKLEKALNDFEYNPKDLIAVDIGASTGGFTDCLLKNGVKKVYAVDLNDDLLHKSLKENDKVIEVIKNAKFINVEDFNEPIDLVVADLSFISSTIILPIISNIIDDEKDVILLIKPQFENDEKIKFKNGIIRDKKYQKQACLKVLDCAKSNNLTPIKFTTAPINRDKNVEYLILLRKNAKYNLNINEFF